MSSNNLDSWLSYSLIAKSLAEIISFLLISSFSCKFSNISCCDVANWPAAFVYPCCKASMLSFPDAVNASNSESLAVSICVFKASKPSVTDIFNCSAVSKINLACSNSNSSKSARIESSTPMVVSVPSKSSNVLIFAFSNTSANRLFSAFCSLAKVCVAASASLMPFFIFLYFFTPDPITNVNPVPIAHAAPLPTAINMPP